MHAQEGIKTNYESIYLYIYHEATELVEYTVRGRRRQQKRLIKPGNKDSENTQLCDYQKEA